MIMERFRISLQPLTPIHVWDGQPRIAGADIVVHAGEAYIVDSSRLAEVVTRARLKLPESLEGLHELILDLIRRGAPVHARKIPAEIGLRPGDEVRLLPPNRIPASTLKGVIRTALLYKLLEEKASIDLQSFRSFLDSYVRLGADPKRMGVSLELAALGKARLRRQGGYSDLLQQLSISEPRFTGVRTVLTKGSVVELDGRLVAEVPLEVVTEGVFEYDAYLLRIDYAKERVRIDESSSTLPDLIDFLSSLSLERIEESLRSFSQKLIEHELELVRRSKEPLARANFDVEGYANLLDEARGLLKGGCSLVKVGFMTGHVAKTIALLLMKHHPQLYDEVRKRLSQIYGRVWDERTLKLIRAGKGYMGIGWAKLCIGRI